MDIAFAVLVLASGLGTMACFVIVLVEMFKRQQTSIAIVCIVLFLGTLTGPLVAFIYGWIKSKPWHLQTVMLAWTCLLAIFLIVAGLWGASAVARQHRPEVEQRQDVDVEDLKIETH